MRRPISSVGALRLHGEALHLLGDHGETLAGLTGAGGLDGSVECEEIGLASDLGDQRHDLIDLGGGGAQAVDAERGMADGLDSLIG